MIEEYMMPTLVVNSGEATNFQINIHDEDGAILDAEYMSCKFYEFCNLGSPVLSVTGSVTVDQQSKVGSVTISLAGDATMSLHGKYVYQMLVEGNDVNIFNRKGIAYFLYNADGMSGADNGV